MEPPLPMKVDDNIAADKLVIDKDVAETRDLEMADTLCSPECPPCNCPRKLGGSSYTTDCTALHHLLRLQLGPSQISRINSAKTAGTREKHIAYSVRFKTVQLRIFSQKNFCRMYHSTRLMDRSTWPFR
uniref:Uncharacterized protein n=1 Tax=Romanomermis culicivorax TaxID=13658 RepID=A0A915L966_ROMCU